MEIYVHIFIESLLPDSSKAGQPQESQGANPYLNVLILFLVHPTTLERVQWPLLLDLRLCLSQRQVIGESRQLAHLFWSLLFPFISISIPVRSWDDSSNPLLSFISLTMGFCQSISSDFIKWRSSSDLTWLAGSLPQSLTGARLVIYQSTVALFLQLLSPDLGDFLVTKSFFPW